MPPQSITYRAAWLFSSAGEFLDNMAIHVVENQILDVGSINSLPKADRTIDLGDCLLIPGLVNAHTHLEFSDLQKPLGYHGIPFTDWIRLILSQRNQSHASGTKQDTIRQGLNECFSTGTWCVGEIATMPVQQNAYQPSGTAPLLRIPPRVVVFLEQLGRMGKRWDELALQRQDLLEASQWLGPEVVSAFSPHAPYSVAPALLDQICQTAIASNRPVAMHLAETVEERQLVESQTGAFIDLLKDLGVYQADSFDEANRIPSILQSLAQCPRSLVIHGNYLKEPELDQIQSYRDRMSVVFCPRTHEYFQHADYPLSAILNRNINLAIGTDSLASNPNLSLFEELKNVAARYPNLSAATLVKLGTENGAKALGLADSKNQPQRYTGKLEARQPAFLSAIRTPDATSRQAPENWIFAEASNCHPVGPWL